MADDDWKSSCVQCIQMLDFLSQKRITKAFIYHDKMSSNTKLIEEEAVEGVPVCSGNMSTPVVDQTNYIMEVHYRIGLTQYIENAD
jgi:hypothetical protein